MLHSPHAPHALHCPVAQTPHVLLHIYFIHCLVQCPARFNDVHDLYWSSQGVEAMIKVVVQTMNNVVQLTTMEEPILPQWWLVWIWSSQRGVYFICFGWSSMRFVIGIFLKLYRVFSRPLCIKYCLFTLHTRVLFLSTIKFRLSLCWRLIYYYILIHFAQTNR